MNGTEKRVYLYCLDREYHVLRYVYLNEDEVSIKRIKDVAGILKTTYPNTRSVFAIDQSYGVCAAYRQTVSSGLMDDRVLFKLMLETDGLRII